MEKFNLNTEEWQYLIYAPFDIALGVAGSDGHIAKEELNPLINYVNQSSFLKDDLSKEVFGEIYDQGQEIWKNHRMRSKETSLKNNLQAVGKILEKIDSNIADPFIENLLRLGMATGFAYGDPNRPMSNEEMNQIGHMFRWMNKDIQKYHDNLMQQNKKVEPEDEQNHGGQYL